MIVADASALVEVLAGHQPSGDLVVRLASDELHVPHLIDVEVLHALRVLTTRRAVRSDVADQAMRSFGELELTRYSQAPLRSRMWELRGNLSAYDAAYVALAEALDSPLVTTDGRIASIAGLGTRVEVFERS